MLESSPTHCNFPGGVTLDFLAPKAADVDFEWVARRLHSRRRFNDNPLALSILAHSLVVWRAVRLAGHGPKVQLVALLHDAAEAFTGDLPAPLRRAIYEVAKLDVITRISAGIDMAVLAAAGYAPSLGELAESEIIVGAYDLRARASEVRDCLGGDWTKWAHMPKPPLDFTISPDMWLASPAEFLAVLAELQAQL